jgi:hypothetical protein
VGGIEDFHSLDPTHEDGIVDPGINIHDGLDHLINVQVFKLINVLFKLINVGFVSSM